jgi:Uma2 family endonuclease
VVTAQVFETLPHNNPRELIRGTIVERPFLGAREGVILGNIGGILSLWAKQTVKNYCGVRVGHILSRNPDTVRIADVSYIRAERLPETGIPEGFWQLAPDLTVEIASFSDSVDEIRDKVSDFLVAGTMLVWVVYPRIKEVIAHTPDGLARTFTEKDVLESDLLPGFSCAVAELFEM